MRFITTSRNGQPITDLVDPIPSSMGGPILSGLSEAYGATILGMNRPTNTYHRSGVITIAPPDQLDETDRVTRFVTLVEGLIARKIEPDAAVDYAFDIMIAGGQL